ncbi:uncharacterized protein N7477_004593 [Penicillium maclennaniae]|uniref:uncharacterized protein n=1 Tax=Penicillium maclennaniae TaxID=1343394 RepID=UPI00254146D1|nr:uncharacterized protein N7477_004593 [Penicillium maclennaniae]KAJ5674659.1 hypothetical protein N7477_004593 [Penicillium maclennaniae]
MPALGLKFPAAFQSPWCTKRRYRADELGKSLRFRCRGGMTHTTGLGVGSATSRHRAPIGREGAECQERNLGGTGHPPLDLSNPRQRCVSFLASLGFTLASVSLRDLGVFGVIKSSPFSRPDPPLLSSKICFTVATVVTRGQFSPQSPTYPIDVAPSLCPTHELKSIVTGRYTLLVTSSHSSSFSRRAFRAGSYVLPPMSEQALPQGEVIGIVIGAIALFSIISIVPIIIMWSHRRNAARRTASETLNATGSMQEPSVARWLAEQNVESDPEQYAQDTW